MSKKQLMAKAIEAYPPCQQVRSGCKVGWRYYTDEKEARKASAVAYRNGRILAARGYDFGYLVPGAIVGPDQQSFHPGMWEVVIP